MRQFVVLCLVLTCPILTFGQAKTATPKGDAASVEQTLIQIERDWMQANTKKDVAALDRILADDWTALDEEGKSQNKAQAVAELKSGVLVIQSAELGPIKVKVFGSTAVAIGSHTSKGTYKGKDASGKYVWTDVFVNRNGRWQAVVSQWARVGK